MVASDGASSGGSDIDRQFNGYGYYPQNPYTDAHMGNMYFPQYNNMYNQGFGLKYGEAHSSSYGDDLSGYGAHSHAGAPHYGGDIGYHGHSGGGYHHGGGGPSHHHHIDSATHTYGAPAPVVHHYPSHSRSHKVSKGNASAMSALTLLAFLFFLNILQSCLKEHMMAMNPTVMVMTAGVRRASMKSSDDGDINDAMDRQIDYSIYASVDDGINDKMSMEPLGDGRSINKTIQAKLNNFDGGRTKTKRLN